VDNQDYTIDQWCHKRKICRATFYNLLKAGKAPRIMRVGSRVRISAVADEAWQRDREAEAVAGRAA
jgi:predicted DNA-binding transcriptional regulator AlpA